MGSDKEILQTLGMMKALKNVEFEHEAYPHRLRHDMRSIGEKFRKKNQRITNRIDKEIANMCRVQRYQENLTTLIGAGITAFIFAVFNYAVRLYFESQKLDSPEELISLTMNSTMPIVTTVDNTTQAAFGYLRGFKWLQRRHEV